MEEHRGQRTTEAAINIDYFPNTVRKLEPKQNHQGKDEANSCILSLV